MAALMKNGGGKGSQAKGFLYINGPAAGGGPGAWGAAALSLLSWPEPSCPKALKPFMVLAATAFWLAALLSATWFGHLLAGAPLFPIGLALLLAGFVGGSVISVLATMLYLACLWAGLAVIRLPENVEEIIITGYRHKDVILVLVFAWLYGVPHWRRRFSWLFTVMWGLLVVFAPLIFIMINLYFFYGHVPDQVEHRFLEREFLLTWGFTVIAAAISAKIFYMAKDYLRGKLGGSAR